MSAQLFPSIPGHVYLQPGFSGHISVQTNDGTELFRKEIASEKEGEDFVNQYGQSIRGSGLLKALFVPLHTDNCADLFSPAFTHLALQVDNCALRLLASVFAIALDAITLVPRLIVALFKTDAPITHPLKTLLPNTPLVNAALLEGKLKIVVHRESFEITSLSPPSSRKSVEDTFTLVHTRQLPQTATKTIRKSGSTHYSSFNPALAQRGYWNVQAIFPYDTVSTSSSFSF